LTQQKLLFVARKWMKMEISASLDVSPKSPGDTRVKNRRREREREREKGEKT